MRSLEAEVKQKCTHFQEVGGEGTWGDTTGAQTATFKHGKAVSLEAPGRRGLAFRGLPGYKPRSTSGAGPGWKDHKDHSGAPADTAPE